MVILRNRLKTSLNLPKIEPRPPCPPRIYSKLYAYFDRELTSGGGRRRGRVVSTAQSTPSRPLPERQAPGLEKGLEGFRGGNRAPRHRIRYGGGDRREDRLPKWVPPAIRVLCAGLDAGKATPHVLAGVDSVLFLQCPGDEDLEGDRTMREGQSAQEEGLRGKMPALIAAVLSFAIVRLTGEETDAKEYNQRVKMVIGVLRSMREDMAMVAKIGEEEEAWKGWEVITKKDVDAWLKEIASKGWLRMDWWENMVGGSGVSGQAEEVYDDEDDEEDDQEARAAEIERERLWKTRSGTMIQDQYDYLSEAKRKQYARWKELMLVKIDGVEGRALDQDMAV